MCTDVQLPKVVPVSSLNSLIKYSPYLILVSFYLPSSLFGGLLPPVLSHRVLSCPCLQLNTAMPRKVGSSATSRSRARCEQGLRLCVTRAAGRAQLGPRNQEHVWSLPAAQGAVCRRGVRRTFSISTALLQLVCVWREGHTRVTSCPCPKILCCCPWSLA